MVPLEVKFDADSSASGCDGGQYKSWIGTAGPGDDRYNQGPGQHDLLDILDVNGQTLGDQSYLLAGQHGRRPGRAPGDRRLHPDHALTQTQAVSPVFHEAWRQYPTAPGLVMPCRLSFDRIATAGDWYSDGDAFAPPR